MAENVTSITLTPDDLTANLVTANGTVVPANTFFSNTLVFKYGCNPTTVFSSYNCFTSTYNFFDARYISSKVASSTSIMSYTLTVNNTNSTTIPSSCSTTLKANTYLLGQTLGGKVR